MPLAMVNAGQKVRLKDIFWGKKLNKRLCDMGLTAGVEFDVVSNAKGASMINLRGTKLVLGRGVAQKILVDLI